VKTKVTLRRRCPDARITSASVLSTERHEMTSGRHEHLSVPRFCISSRGAEGNLPASSRR